MRNMTHDRFIYLICLIVFLSYLPGESFDEKSFVLFCLLFVEAGQYSCFFVYLRLVSIYFQIF